MSEPTFEITTLPDDPFYTGSGQRDREETGLPVSVDGRGFVIDMSDTSYRYRYQRTGLDLINSQQQSSGADQAFLPPEVWRRTAQSWEGGSGQKRFDRATSQETRFNNSHNIDVWTPWSMSLLPAVDLIQALPSGRTKVFTVGPSYLFAVNGQTGYWWTDITLPPTVHDFGSTVISSCSDGQYLYTIDGAGVVTRWADPTTSIPWATVSAGFNASRTILRYVKGFLIVATANFLYDISTGTPVKIHEHPLVAYDYIDACEGSSVAYLMAGTGDKWAVLAMNIKPDGTGYDPPIVAGPLPDGEIGLSVASYLGYVMAGTDQGWRFGVVSDASGSVTFGRLVNTGSNVRCFEGQDRFVWYGMAATSTTTAGLGRADLSNFVQTLTPASAPDLSTTVTAGDVWDVCTFKNKRIFAVDGSGIWAQSNLLASYGWLDQGLISFNTSDPKMGLYVQPHMLPLNGTLAIDLRYDDGAFAEVTSDSNQGTTDMGNIVMSRSFGIMAIRYRLYPSVMSPDLGPNVSRMEVRVLPISGRAMEWRVPLLINDTYEYGDIMQERNIESDVAGLINLYETRRPFIFREGDQSYTLYCTNFSWFPEARTYNGKTFKGVYVLIARQVV